MMIRKTCAVLTAVLMICFMTTGCANHSETDQPPAAMEIKDNASVSYLGPQGTYTEEAAQLFFQNGAQLDPKNTVEEAITDVVNGSSDYAMIPQENTVGGTVTNYLDALIAVDDVFCGWRSDPADQPDTDGNTRKFTGRYTDRLFSCPGHRTERQVEK